MAKKQPIYKLSGINPLAYLGVEPPTPPELTVQGRIPTPNDRKFHIGTIWTTRSPAILSIWMLVDLDRGVATWIQLYPGGGGGGTTDFPCNIGTAVQSGGILNILGTSPMQTTGSGNTVTIELTNGADGQVIIGGGSGPAWANLTAGDGITITNGPNSIIIAGEQGEGIKSIDTNSGSAAPIGGVIEIVGDNLIETSASGNTVTVALERSLDGQIPIGATGAPTVFANITSPMGTILITNKPNAIELEANSGSGATNISFFGRLSGLASNVIGDSLSPAYLGALGGRVMTQVYSYGGGYYAGDGTLNPALFTAPIDGIYWIACGVQPFASSYPPVQTYFEVGISKNYNTISQEDFPFSSVNFTNCLIPPIGNQINQGGGSLVLLNSGDTVSFYVIVGPASGSSSKNISIVTNTSQPNLSPTWVAGFIVRPL